MTDNIAQMRAVFAAYSECAYSKQSMTPNQIARKLIGAVTVTAQPVTDKRKIDMLCLLRNQIEAANRHQQMIAWTEPETAETLLALLTESPAPEAVRDAEYDILLNAIQRIIANDPYKQSSAGIIARDAIAAIQAKKGSGT